MIENIRKKTPAKIMEYLAGQAFIWNHFFSPKEHEIKRRRCPEAYQPGFLYQKLTSEEDREILKNLASKDLQNTPTYLLPNFYNGM